MQVHAAQYQNPITREWQSRKLGGHSAAQHAYNEGVSGWPGLSWRLLRQEGKQAAVLKEHNPHVD